jgi:hypothetical protein
MQGRDLREINAFFNFFNFLDFKFCNRKNIGILYF